MAVGEGERFRDFFDFEDFGFGRDLDLWSDSSEEDDDGEDEWVRFFFLDFFDFRPRSLSLSSSVTVPVFDFLRRLPPRPSLLLSFSLSLSLLCFERFDLFDFEDLASDSSELWSSSFALLLLRLLERESSSLLSSLYFRRLRRCLESGSLSLLSSSSSASPTRNWRS